MIGKRLKAFCLIHYLTAIPWILARMLVLIPSTGLCAEAEKQADLSEMPISFPIQSPETAQYFEEIARPEDIVSFPFQFSYLAGQITKGQRLVGFASWQQAEQELPHLIGQIEMVMYNPEHWENTPAEEQSALAATVRDASEYAHSLGLTFVFAPDRRYAEAHLGEVAPYVDIVFLQGQRIQDDLPAFSAWIFQMVAAARAANPQIEIFVQVGATRGSAQQMHDAIQTVAGEINGIAIWSMPRTLNILQEFIVMLRGNPSVGASPSPTDLHTPISRPAQTSEPSSGNKPATLPPPTSPTASEPIIAATATPPAVVAAASLAAPSASGTTTSPSGSLDFNPAGGQALLLLLVGVGTVFAIVLGLQAARKSGGS